MILKNYTKKHIENLNEKLVEYVKAKYSDAEEYLNSIDFCGYKNFVSLCAHTMAEEIYDDIFSDFYEANTKKRPALEELKSYDLTLKNSDYDKKLVEFLENKGNLIALFESEYSDYERLVDKTLLVFIFDRKTNNKHFVYVKNKKLESEIKDLVFYIFQKKMKNMLKK